MNGQLAKRLFKQADDLYRGKNYAAALEILDRLNAAFPDTRRIMYPRAMCLAEVGRVEEAIAICDRLISRHKYKRARELKARVQKYERVLPAWNAGVGPGLTDSGIRRLDVGNGPSAFHVAPPPPVPVWRSTGARFAVGVALFVVAIAAGFGYYFMTQDAGVANAAQTVPVAVPLESGDPLPPLEPESPPSDAPEQSPTAEPGS